VRKLKHNCLQHLDNEEDIIYLVGHHLAQFNYEKRSHKFILKSNKTREIFTFSISQGKKYIALSERLVENNAIQVSVYNFKLATRVRTIPFPNNNGPVIAIDFSKDSKYLACVTAEPDNAIFLWSLDKSRKIASKEISFQVSQLSVNPNAYWQMCTTGPDTCKIWRFTENELKPIDPITNRKYTVCNITHISLSLFF